MKINEKMTKLRKKKGLSQDELSEKLNISRQTISKWENATAKPDLDNLMKLCELYNITLSELIDEEDINDEKVDNIVNKNVKESEYFKSLKRLIIIVIVLSVIELLIGFIPLLKSFW